MQAQSNELRSIRETEVAPDQRHLATEVRELKESPIVIGSGKKLFRVAETRALRLVDSKPTPTGCVILTYQPIRELLPPFGAEIWSRGTASPRQKGGISPLMMSALSFSNSGTRSSMKPPLVE
jgi:hypothetical protein